MSSTTEQPRNRRYIRVSHQRKTKLCWPENSIEHQNVHRRHSSSSSSASIYIRVYTSEADFHKPGKPGIYGGRVRVWAAQHLYVRRDIMLKDGPITTSSKVRSIKFELLKDCLRIGDGDWWGKRRDRAAVETCDLCRRELWRSRDRARPLVQLGCWGNRRRRGCLLYTSPSPRDKRQARMPSSA